MLPQIDEAHREYFNAAFVRPELVRSAMPYEIEEPYPINDGFLSHMLERNVRSVLNLDDTPSKKLVDFYNPERAWAEENRIRYGGLGLEGSYPQRERLLEIIDFIEQSEGLLWIHCAAGKDRAGFGTALTLHLKYDSPVRDAMKEGLTPDFKHDTFYTWDHLLYYFVTEIEGISLKEWIEKGYDAESLWEHYNGMLSTSLMNLAQQEGNVLTLDSNSEENPQSGFQMMGKQLFTKLAKQGFFKIPEN